MPTPRRKLHALVTDANGAIPIYHGGPVKVATTQRRCMNRDCRCILASDNLQPFCSPCQRRLNGVPDHLSMYLPYKP
jgi:hypothetical protein